MLWPLYLIQFKLAQYEHLESLSLLEEELWKLKIDESKLSKASECEEEPSHKKCKIDLSKSMDVAIISRKSCRINCGAEIVISSVLPSLC